MGTTQNIFIGLVAIPIGLFLVAVVAWQLFIIFEVVFVLRAPLIMMGMMGQIIVRPFMLIYYALGSLVFRDGPQEPNPDVSSVSGFYGPGTYWAWVLGMLSATTMALFDPGHAPPSGDFVVCMVYAIASSVHFYQRAYALYLGKHALIQDAELQAAMHIFYSTIPFFFIIMIAKTGRTRVIWWMAYILTGCWAMPLIWGDIDPTPDPDMKELIYQGMLALWQLIILVVLLEAQVDFSGCTTLCSFISLLVHLVLLEIGGRRPSSFSFPSFTPRSESKLFDFDQSAALVGGVVLIAYQWKLWHLPKRGLRFMQRRAHVRSNSLVLEKGGDH